MKRNFCHDAVNELGDTQEPPRGRQEAASDQAHAALKCQLATLSMKQLHSEAAIKKYFLKKANFFEKWLIVQNYMPDLMFHGLLQCSRPRRVEPCWSCRRSTCFGRARVGQSRMHQWGP